MEFASRRESLIAQTSRKALFILPAATEKTRNSDNYFPFRQNSDFYYLTGFNEPDAIALIAPDHPQGEYILFNRPRDSALEIWHGYRAGQEGAVNEYGADAAYDIGEFWQRLPEFLNGYESIIAPFGRSRASISSCFHC